MTKHIHSKILIALAIASFSTAYAAEQSGASIKVYITAKDTGQKLSRAADLSFVAMPQPGEKQETIFVDASKTYQTVLGVGGALTDAAAETFYKLPKDKQQEILQAYFDPEKGIGYSLGRTHIHSCDFSSESYTYVKNGDTSLNSFDISHDLKYRIPFIKEILATAGANNFTIFASPWSPPAWMKDNNDMLHGGKLKPEYYGTWANYCAKFIKAYEKQGVPIWGMTVQNEPMAIQTWESCIYTAEEERDFVKNYLGPTFAKDGLAKKNIVIWDHNRSLMYQRAAVVLEDPEAARFVWGVGYHWYVGDHFENVKMVQQAFPNTHLLFTEGCNGPYDSATIDDWKWGENYGKSMVNDFNNGAVGWTDWNVLLDQEGGPNHVQNFCFAPIHGDTKTGALHYMNSYYYIGHFSKFVRPGARRIVSSSTTDNLITTAFLNNDKNIVVIVMNSTAKAQPFYLWMDDKEAKSQSPAHSIMTLVLPQA
ncbi:MAG TPA: glycoside hydrolase family 30 protein [Verrucomicrobiae bacterium]|jgi:glucosylceramidase|nr:glycoside hydrolase family 30 protein [Verrucomicrobiae bacterium]